MICYCHLEILNHFWARGPVFSFCTRSTDYAPDPECGRQRIGLPQNQIHFTEGLNSEEAKQGCHPSNTSLCPHPILPRNMASTIFRPGWGGAGAGQWRAAKLGVKTIGKAVKVTGRSCSGCARGKEAGGGSHGKGIREDGGQRDQMKGPTPRLGLV